MSVFLQVLDIILKFAKRSGQHIEKFRVVDNVIKSLHAASTSDMCNHYMLQDRWEQFILNYKLTQLKQNLKTTSGPSHDSTTFNHTTSS
jgi:hypothetical protein